MTIPIPRPTHPSPLSAISPPLGSPAAPDYITDNLPFVLKIAREYQGKGLILEDLYMEGVLGLLQAVEHFDPGRGVRFITYAVWWIRRAVVNAVARSARQVRLPRYRSHQLRQFRRQWNDLAGQLGRAPEPEELAGSLGLTLAEAVTRPTSYPVEVSLDHPAGGPDGGRPVDSLVAPGHSPERALLSAETWSLLSEALAGLPDRERAVLEARFGLGNEPPRTLRELGVRMRITKERVRQIELRAVRLLRARLEGRIEP